MGDYRRARRRLEQATADKAGLQAELTAIKGRAEAKANADFMAEHDRLLRFEADSKVKAEADAREAIRTRNADAILAGVDEKQRGDVALMLAGMQQAGNIDLYDEAEGAAAALIETLSKDRPGWFKPPEGGPTGPTGAPGHGMPSGSVLGMGEEQIHAISDDAWKERINQPLDEGPVRL